MSWRGVLKGISKVALPIVGTALGGPLGGIAAGALSGAIGGGKPTLKGVGMGALGGAAAGIGGGALGGIGSNIAKQGVLKGIGSSLLNNKDLLLAGAGMVQGGMQQGKADKLNQQALDFQKQQYANWAPLDAQARAGLADQSRPDLSAVYGGTQNPFAQGNQPVPLNAKKVLRGV